jgi:hypothetical protein
VGTEECGNLYSGVEYKNLWNGMWEPVEWNVKKLGTSGAEYRNLRSGIL